MKSNIIMLGVVLSISCVDKVFSQAFQNLDFEDANVTGYSPGQGIPISQALPGWNGYLIDSGTGTTTPDTTVSYDGVSTGGAGLALIGLGQSGNEPIQGNFSLFMFGGGNPSTIASEVAQTGLIPSGSESLLMKAWEGLNASPTVEINGQVIDMVPLQTISDPSSFGGSYKIYGGNISAFAGQVGALSFIDPAPSSSPASQFILDDISFSTSSVPEPNTLFLEAIGSLVGIISSLRIRHR